MRDEDGDIAEPCLSCDKAYIEDIWNEWCCDEKECLYKKEKALKVWHESVKFNEIECSGELQEAISTAFKALEQEPCEDAISRQATVERLCKIAEFMNEKRDGLGSPYVMAALFIQDNKDEFPPVTPQPKTGHCKDCKWWKDSDGAYRRGIGAESQCPMNRKEVYEGNGYCFLFKPRESEE